MKRKIMELDLGCGFNKIGDTISVDKNKEAKPDIIHDLNDIPYPFKNNYFDKVNLRHVLEHLDEPEKVLNEVLRISKDNALIYIEVPHFSIYASHIFNHKKTYSCQAFKIFCKENRNFELEKIELRWMRNKDVHNFIYGLFNNFLSYLANLNYHFCERIWCYWVGGFTEIKVWIKIKK
jgi:SAM-dependent methyltransferase